jgi:alpha-tubulin suppressor-like RCC1 family protein
MPRTLPGAARTAVAGVAMMGLALLAAGCGDTSGPFGPEEIPVFSDVAAGANHSCGVTEGRVFCWGSDLYAQSSGATVGAGGPVFAQVALPGAAEAVTAGQRHTCALLTSGQVLCWGWNHLGQLANGELEGVRGPQLAVGEHAFSSIDAGWNHTCGISEGRTLCWGAGAQGRLGNGGYEDRGTPVEVAGDTAFVQVTAGGLHTCGLAVDGVAYCWGLNHAGQLGTGVAESSPVPVQVAGGDRFTSLAAGFHHTCGVLVGGGLKCWGSNVFGELGNGGLEAAGLPGSLVPGPVGFTDGMVRVDAGAHFTCSSLANGDTACWGRGVEGQLGAGMAYSHSWPQRIAGVAGPNRGGGDLPISKLALGVQHTCGLSQGAIYCWGTGPHGELGSGRTTYTNVPTRVYGR